MNETFHIELKWYNQLIFNIWLNISSNVVIIWIILIIYLHFVVYYNMYFFTNILFNHLISIKKCNFFWQLHYLVVELPYFEYNLWKPLLILVWWKLKITQFLKTIVVRTCFGHHNTLSPFVQKVHILLQKVFYKWSVYNQSTFINYKWA